MHKDPGQQAHTGSSQAHIVRNLQGLEAALFLEEEEGSLRVEEEKGNVNKSLSYWHQAYSGVQTESMVSSVLAVIPGVQENSAIINPVYICCYRFSQPL